METKKISVLIIKTSPEHFFEKLRSRLPASISLQIAKTGMTGLAQCQKLKPAIVIVDTNLPDLHGMSIATTIKDNYECRHSTVYLIGIENLLDNTKADRYIYKDTPFEILLAQLQRDLNQLSMDAGLPEEWENGIIRQYDCLVSDYTQEDTDGAFAVTRILSPYHFLSGDGVFYNLLKDTKGLYGFIFDCEGHDLSSYGQAAAILYILKLNLWQYQAGILQDLAQVMAAVNEEIFSAFNNTLIPALCFHVDIKFRILHYCSAGIPTFYVKHRSKPMAESVPCRSYILGYDRKSTWQEKQLSLETIEEITFITDGLNDLLRDKINKEKPSCAKHDDISAIFIKLFDK